MSNLIQIEDLTMFNGEQCMSTLQIADLTEKNHADVLRDARRMLVKIQSQQKCGDYKDNRGRTQPCLMLNKNETFCLVTGYSVELRMAVIKRWDELERGLAQPAAKTPALPDFSDPAAAARAWADEFEQKLLAQKQLELAAPKINVYDRIIESGNLHNATQVAQKMERSAVWLNKMLEGFNVYSKSIKRGRVFRQWFVDAGYGIMRETSNGHSQAMFTSAGEAWIVEKLTGEGVID